MRKLANTIVALCLVAPFAHADLIITLTPLPDGAVRAVGVGSGVVSGSTTSDDWDYNDFVGNFLAIGTESATTENLVGAFTNETTGIVYDLQSFQVDEDGGNEVNEDDIDIDTLIDAVFTAGDEFSFSMNAVFPPVTIDDGNEALLYSGLVPGIYTALGGGVNGDENIFGDATLVVVPEPTTVAMIALAAAALAARGRG